MFGSLDPAKLLVVLVLALIVIGPERLPKAARQLGEAWRELTHLRERVAEEVRSALPDLGLDDLDLPHLPRSPAAAVSSFVRDLTSGMAPGTPSTAADVEVLGGPGDDTGMEAPFAAPTDHPARGPRGGGGAPRRLSPGEAIPERAVLVTFAPESGELAVTYDDPAMN